MKITEFDIAMHRSAMQQRAEKMKRMGLVQDPITTQILEDLLAHWPKWQEIAEGLSAKSLDGEEVSISQAVVHVFLGIAASTMLENRHAGGKAEFLRIAGITWDLNAPVHADKHN